MKTVYASAIAYVNAQGDSRFGVKRLTEKAILIEVSHNSNDHFVWLPLTQITFHQDAGGNLLIGMPAWLAQKNGLECVSYTKEPRTLDMFPDGELNMHIATRVK